MPGLCGLAVRAEFLTAESKAAGKSARSTRASDLAVVVAAAEVVDEHLFDGLVVGDEDMADGVSADEVADFLGEVLGMIAGAFERLGHEDDLQAGLAVNVFGILDVAQEDEVAEAVHFGVGAEDVDGFADFSGGEGGAAVGQHFFEDGRHLGEVAGVFGVDASADRQGAVGEAEQEVADALEADHELHAGKEFAGFGGADFGDGSGHAVVDFRVERIEFALPQAEGVEQGGRSGGDAFGGGAGGFFRHIASFHGAAHEVLMGRLRIGRLGRGAHTYVRRARTGATKGVLGALVAIRPFWRWATTKHRTSSGSSG